MFAVAEGTAKWSAWKLKLQWLHGSTGRAFSPQGFHSQTLLPPLPAGTEVMVDATQK